MMSDVSSNVVSLHDAIKAKEERIIDRMVYVVGAFVNETRHLTRDEQKVINKALLRGCSSLKKHKQS